MRTLITIALLVVTLTLLGAWIASYFVTLNLRNHVATYRGAGERSREWIRIEVTSVDGVITFSGSRWNYSEAAEEDRAESTWEWWTYRNDRSTSAFRWSTLGFAIYRSDVVFSQGRLIGDRGAVPYWFLALISAALPAQQYWKRRRRRRRALDLLCARCGYDLRASPERCPECGCAAASLE